MAKCLGTVSYLNYLLHHQRLQVLLQNTFPDISEDSSDVFRVYCSCEVIEEWTGTVTSGGFELVNKEELDVTYLEKYSFFLDKRWFPYQSVIPSEIRKVLSDI